MEFCEDAVNNGILYVEARFCPHLMLSDKIPEVTAKDVVQTVLCGFLEGEAKFGLKVRIFKNILHKLYLKLHFINFCIILIKTRLGQYSAVLVVYTNSLKMFWIFAKSSETMEWLE